MCEPARPPRPAILPARGRVGAQPCLRPRTLSTLPRYAAPMTTHVPPPEPERPITLAIRALRAAGHVVEASRDVAGLYEVDGGPLLTTAQVIALARAKGLL